MSEDDEGEPNNHADRRSRRRVTTINTCGQRPPDSYTPCSTTKGPCDAQGPQGHYERRVHIRSPHLEAARYRKSRTITRNAEAAIYDVPCIAARRSPLSGNNSGRCCSVGGSPLRFLSSLEPISGSRWWTWLRDAHIRGLGGYIFWPFGKHVRGDAEISARGDDKDPLVVPVRVTRIVAPLGH